MDWLEDWATLNRYSDDNAQNSNCLQVGCRNLVKGSIKCENHMFMLLASSDRMANKIRESFGEACYEPTTRRFYAILGFD